ncbi:MAG TPA: T9SS type A sorting domain-containing protein [Paludibacter sp.]|nr:T9SS type A sorting domain-containing protein [Paludibacter sp.]
MRKITSFIFGLFCVLSVANAQDITVFDFDGTTPTFTGDDQIVTIANPATDGINASANVGQLTHTGQWRDANTAVDIDPRFYNSIEMMVYSPYSTTGKVTIACFDASGNQLDWYESSAIATAGAWTKLTRNLSFTSKIASVKVGFNRNDVPSATANDNIVYFDNLVFKKNTSPFLTLYSETFFASWSQWDNWKGLPTEKASLWYGGIDLQTTGNDTIRLDQWWGDHGHILKINSTDSTVIIPGIDVAGFDSLKISYDSHDESAQPIIDVKVGSGAWVSVPTSPQSWSWQWRSVVTLLKDESNNPINNVSTISVRFSHPAANALFFDNVKILGKVHDNGVATSVDGQAKNIVSVYPNPAQNYIMAPNAQKVVIADLNGRIVKTAFNTERVDISSLAQGVYVVKVTANNADKFAKLVKE